ncbi:probable methyltransferase At1g29790 [Andrographis paniculata]|uniref:probable methyltransferase At1g29790 n=1 Tax=Andrographis paniculata TaxID=175694 RepID=UPI0021E96F8E|nr:probable methyltransferase At1g29790 [Andrographis paniculata]
MDVQNPPKTNPIFSYYKNVFFLFLLLSSNLLTLLISTTFSSYYNPNPNSQHPAAAVAAADPPPDLPPEFVAFTAPQKLPFGFNHNFGSDQILPPVGSHCAAFAADLRSYMSYEVNGSCPDDEVLAQKLLLRGCEPLPRRRCRPAAPAHYAEPRPLPESLWTTPPDNSVVWTAYTCKNYTCLINRRQEQKGFDDCKDCFDLNGRERSRWTAVAQSNLDFSIDEVLAAAAPGTIRIGLDIGGGTATFAVRMRERNVTVVTTSMNLNGPFSSFIAGRGVVPLYLSISQRLPFFDNTVDIVHSMHVLSGWVPARLLHFAMFDIYRVVRPGGLFWLDHFFSGGGEMAEVHAPLIESVGWKKVKWEFGKKLDRGAHLNEVYLSALLQKPIDNSW